MIHDIISLHGPLTIVLLLTILHVGAVLESFCTGSPLFGSNDMLRRGHGHAELFDNTQNPIPRRQNICAV